MTQGDVLGHLAGGRGVPDQEVQTEEFTDYFFLRQLRPDDARQIVEFFEIIEASPELECDADESTGRFGVFNIKYELIGVFVTISKAFKQANDKNLKLYWVQ